MKVYKKKELSELSLQPLSAHVKMAFWDSKRDREPDAQTQDAILTVANEGDRNDRNVQVWNNLSQ